MAKGIKAASPKRLNSALLVAVLCLLLSCSGYSLHNYQSVGGGWHKGCSLAFVQDSATLCAADSLDLYVGLRYDASYKYKNLCMRVESFAAGDSLMFSDTLCCDIFDETGRRNGSTAGTLYQAEFYAFPIERPHCGSHTIRLQHVMRDTLLQGVYDVGVKLVPRGRHQCAEK